MIALAVRDGRVAVAGRRSDVKDIHPLMTMLGGEIVHGIPEGVLAELG